MLYMVVERYTNGPRPVYERAAARGRMLPERLRYLIRSDEAAARVAIAWPGGAGPAH